MVVFHQIWQGDSRVEGLRFKPNTIDCIITDPPFGVDNQSNMAVTDHGKDYARKIAGDASPEEAIKLFQEVMDVILPKTKDDCDLYIFTAWQVLSEWLILAKSLKRHGFNMSALLVWEKDGPGMGDLEGWGMGHEVIIFLKKGRKPRYSKRRNGVLHIPQVRPGDLIHPHEKPHQLLETLLKHSTQEGDFVVDPFSGSGSLVRACKTLNRNSVGIEYDERNWRVSSDKLNSQEEGLF